MVLLKTLQVDPGLTDDELKSHLDWEVEQFIISPREEYNIAFERLNSNDERVAFVSIRSKVIDYIKAIFSQTRFNLQSVDVDLFAAIRGLNLNFVKAKASYALLELAEKEMSFSLVHDNRFLCASEVKFPAKGPGEMEIGEATDAELAKIIYDELNRLLQQEDVGFGVQDLRVVFACGEKLTDSIIKELGKLYSIRVQTVNPFEHIKVKESPYIADAIRIRPDRFPVSAGMAI